MKKKLHPQPRGVIIEPRCKLERISSSKEVQSVKRKTSLENLFPHHFASFIFGVIYIYCFIWSLKGFMSDLENLVGSLWGTFHQEQDYGGIFVLTLWKEYSHINTIFHSSSDGENCRWYLSSTVPHLK